jgi:hypothetical protein
MVTLASYCDARTSDRYCCDARYYCDAQRHEESNVRQSCEATKVNDARVFPLARRNELPVGELRRRCPDVAVGIGEGAGHREHRLPRAIGVGWTRRVPWYLEWLVSCQCVC